MLRVAALLIFFVTRLVLADTDNQARNPGFEQSLMSGAAPGWTLVHWDADNAVVGDVDTGVFHAGTRAFRIDVPAPDDARIEQVIPVLASHWYHFSAWVRTKNVANDKVGANLSIIGSMEHSPDVRGTRGWQKIEVWGKTASDQTEIQLAARLGFYGANTTGQVWFDDIQVLAVDAPPHGAPQMSLTASPTPASALGNTVLPPTHKSGLLTRKPTPASALGNTVLLMNSAAILVAAVFVLLALGVIHQRQTLATLIIEPWQLAMTGALALAIKLALAGYFFGYGPDINLFSAWAIDLYQQGPSAFYRAGHFVDYPPGYMYLLWCVGAIAQHLHLSSATPAFLMVLKLPAILADVWVAWWLFRWGDQQHARESARVAAVLWLINPLAILTSSVWGQVDILFTLVLVLSLTAFERAQFPRAAAGYALAIILKPQALLLAPLGVIALLQMPTWRIRCLSVGSFIVVAVVLILPFAWQQASPWWIFSLYGETLGSYPYLSLNAFNLYTLLNANWLPLDTTLLGVGVATWAWLLVICSLLPVLYCAWRSRMAGRYLWAAAAIVAVFFVFGPKMHERYLFPAALLTLVSWLWLQDRRLLLIAIGFSLTCFLNTWVTLDAMARLNSSFVAYGQWLLPPVSLINVGLAGYLLYVGWQVLMRQQCLPLRKRTASAQVPSASATPATASRGTASG